MKRRVQDSVRGEFEKFIALGYVSKQYFYLIVIYALF